MNHTFINLITFLFTDTFSTITKVFPAPFSSRKIEILQDKSILKLLECLFLFDDCRKLTLLSIIHLYYYLEKWVVKLCKNHAALTKKCKAQVLFSGHQMALQTQGSFSARALLLFGANYKYFLPIWHRFCIGWYRKIDKGIAVYLSKRREKKSSSPSSKYRELKSPNMPTPFNQYRLKFKPNSRLRPTWLGY